MHGLNIKIISDQQAKIYNIYKNVKLKLLKTNAAIAFNKVCRNNHLTPNYIRIKVGGNNPQSNRTTIAAIKYIC
jgi:hypothetical protein